MLRIIHARSGVHFDQVRLLMREYRDVVIALAGATGGCT